MRVRTLLGPTHTCNDAREMMRTRLATYARRHPVKTAFYGTVLILALVALALPTAALTRWWLFSRQVAALASLPPSGNPACVEWPVRFRGAQYRVAVHVYPSEIEAGRRLDTAWVFASRGAVRERYVRTLVQQQARARLVNELACQAQDVRDLLRLNNDAYLELLARIVQDIPYGRIGSEIGMPAEMIAEGRGVCTEKSVLLAALMLHEGYETAVLVLDSYHHTAVGVRSDDARFRTLPYAFVETTARRSVGEYDPGLLGWGPIGRPPQTIRLGGSKRFGGS
jgi:Transglutaminase-like domain